MREHTNEQVISDSGECCSDDKAEWWLESWPGEVLLTTWSGRLLWKDSNWLRSELFKLDKSSVSFITALWPSTTLELLHRMRSPASAHGLIHTPPGAVNKRTGHIPLAISLWPYPSGILLSEKWREVLGDICTAFPWDSSVNQILGITGMKTVAQRAWRTYPRSSR